MFKKIIEVKKGFMNPLISNMVLVSVLTILSKIISFFKESLIASTFGLSVILDTYYLAILIPSIIQNVFIGALNNLFIPNYINELKTTNQRGNFQVFIVYSIAALVIILIIIALFFSEILLEYIFPGHEVEYYNLVRNQLYYVLPCLIFWGYTAFLSGLLEINNNYFASTLSQLFMPIVMIISLIYFKELFGDKVLVIGMLLGSIIGFVYIFIISLYFRTLILGKCKINKNMKVMLKQYPAKVSSSILTGINPFVDQFFAAQLVVGSIAAINYGIKIPAFAVGILIMAIGNVLLPHFSKLINTNPERAFLQLFKILKIIFFSSLLIAIVVIIFSNNIISFLFERNEFTSQDTKIVARIQQIALLYVPFYLCTLVCVKFLTAINKNKFMAWTSLWNLLLNLILNYVLIKYYGVYGLVGSTTFVYIIASFIYVSYTYKQFKIHLNFKG